MPNVSIIVPAYNALETLPETLWSLLTQTYMNLEVIIVDDGSTDGTADWVKCQDDPRIRLIRQDNRGLAGARNSGIAAARGPLIGFCDADDVWEMDKLERQVAFLDANSAVGVSYSGSLLVDGSNRSLGLVQRPKCRAVTTADVLLRNPVGNGSAAVVRKQVFDEIAFQPNGDGRNWYFDETLRQSEDIECWMRIALTTNWRFGGLDVPLTRYRIVASGLSANLERQFETWQKMADSVRRIAPAFARRWLPAAEAYQLRYLARRAVSGGDGRAAATLMARSLRCSLHPLFHEPSKTLTTLGAACLLLAAGGRGLPRRFRRAVA